MSQKKSKQQKRIDRAKRDFENEVFSPRFPFLSPEPDEEAEEILREVLDGMDDDEHDELMAELDEMTDDDWNDILTEIDEMEEFADDGDKFGPGDWDLVDAEDAFAEYAKMIYIKIALDTNSQIPDPVKTMRTVLEMAQIAWNIVTLSDSKGDSKKRLAEHPLSGIPEEARDEARSWLKIMIDMKWKLHPEFDTIVDSFTVTLPRRNGEFKITSDMSYPEKE